VLYRLEIDQFVMILSSAMKLNRKSNSLVTDPASFVRSKWIL